VVRHERERGVVAQHLDEARFFLLRQSGAQGVADDGQHYDPAALLKSNNQNARTKTNTGKKNS
jgi:hypothetical protein